MFCVRIQGEEYDQKTPHHTKIHFLLQGKIEMVHLRNAIDDGRIQTEIDQPLVFSVVAQADHIIWCHFGLFQLNIQVSWNMKGSRRRCMMVFVATLFIFLYGLWHT